MVALVLTLPPPPVPSTRRTSGMRRSCAAFSAQPILLPMAPSAAPPRTVKSSAPTTTGRPSMRPRPQTKFEGVKPVRLPASSYSARPASRPVSWKLPGSSRRSMRSRTVSRPASRARATRSSPPIRSAYSARRAISSSSGFQDTARWYSLAPDEGAGPRLRRRDLGQRARGLRRGAADLRRAAAARSRLAAARERAAERRGAARRSSPPSSTLMPLGNRAEDYAVVLAALEAGVALTDQADYDACTRARTSAWLRALPRALLRGARRARRARSGGLGALLPPYRAAPRAAAPARGRRPARDRHRQGPPLRRAHLLAALRHRRPLRPRRVLDKETGVSKRAHLVALLARGRACPSPRSPSSTTRSTTCDRGGAARRALRARGLGLQRPARARPRRARRGFLGLHASRDVEALPLRTRPSLARRTLR